MKASPPCHRCWPPSPPSRAPCWSQRARPGQKEQFFPVLVYRTGAYAPTACHGPTGYVDYLKLVNAAAASTA